MRSVAMPQELMRKLRDPSVRKGKEPYYNTIERCLQAYIYLQGRKKAIVDIAIAMDPLVSGMDLEHKQVVQC